MEEREKSREMEVWSCNVRKSVKAMWSFQDEVGERGVDMILIQEMPVGRECLRQLEGYEVYSGRTGEAEKKDTYVASYVHNRWRGRVRVRERKDKQVALGVEIDMGRWVEIWNIYVP